MPASRWNTDLMDLISWVDEDDFAISDFLLQPILTRVGGENDADVNVEELQADDPIPDVLPILPLRGLVVYPETAVPLTIGQPRSIRLVDEVVAGDNRLIGLIASREPELETPGPDDLFSVGTVATVHRMLRAPDGTIRLLVQGIARFKVMEFVEIGRASCRERV